jgi:glycosyltransferase involved in cell wall biosynthesis
MTAPSSRPEPASDAPGGAERDLLRTPLLEALAPATVVVCFLDAPTVDPPVPAGITATACDASGFVRAVASVTAGGDRGPDVVWLRGRWNWHRLRSFVDEHRAHLAGNAGSRAPVLMVDGPSTPELPPGAAPTAYAAHLRRGESARLGLQEAVEDAARTLDADATVLRSADGGGTVVVIPAAVASGALAGWLDGHAPLLATAERAHEEHLALLLRTYELFALADGATRDGVAIVRSLRFRVGTRAVRIARTIARRDQREIFRAPRRAVTRRRVVEAWRSRLEAERAAAPAAARPRPAGLRVTYLLPELRLTGGALVVAELADELRRLGADARIATIRLRANASRLPLLAEPLVFGDARALATGLPPTDVVVATHWSTAVWARDAVRAGRARRAAYYVQDYEAWFYDETDVATRAAVKDSYALVRDKIVTSAWLSGLLADDGVDAATVIPPGLDLDLFHPRRTGPVAAPVVLAMARPRTPRRGFDTVVAALERVHRALPHAEIVLFGERLGKMPLPFPYRGAGVVTDRDRLARLYSRATLHVDGSDFQAFGRAGLEAMACGTPSVLTDVGGVHEYAQQDVNAVLVPPRDPAAVADAVVTLLTDDARRDRLRQEGLRTVERFSMPARAREILEHLTALAEWGVNPRVTM